MTKEKPTITRRPVFAGFAGGSLLTVFGWCLVLLTHAGAGRTTVGTALSAYSAAVCGALSQLFVKVLLFNTILLIYYYTTLLVYVYTYILVY